MKCASCGGALTGAMTFCPFCGVRQEIDLRQIHFRELSDPLKKLPCPECATPMGVIEIDTLPPLHIERCPKGHGLFFNPGELEAVLNHKTEAAVRYDAGMIDQINADFGHRDHEIIYRKCPFCAERMSHLNFGGRSGVILDKCGTHGVWLDAGELRRLAEWWRAGGKHIHAAEEGKRIGKLFAQPPPKSAARGTIESPQKTTDWTWTDGMPLDLTDLIEILIRLGVSFVSDE